MTFAGIAVRHPGKLTLIAAFLLIAGLYGLVVATHDTAFSSEPAFLGVSLLVFGCGLGLVWPHLSVRILSPAPAGEEEPESACVTIVPLVTRTLGAAFSGMVANYGV